MRRDHPPQGVPGWPTLTEQSPGQAEIPQGIWREAFFVRPNHRSAEVQEAELFYLLCLLFTDEQLCQNAPYFAYCVKSYYKAIGF